MEGFYPANIWMVSKQEFDSFVCTGAKVIYIADEPEQNIKHPSVVTASILLPPLEAIEPMLDGNMEYASFVYGCYLDQPEPMQYISVILAAALGQTPVGIMFGDDELNVRVHEMFLNYLFSRYGLYLGVNGQQYGGPSKAPAFLIQSMPYVLALLYSMDILSYANFMELHPNLPIHPSVIAKLAYDVQPAVASKDIHHYAEYFETIRAATQINGHRYLIDPLIGDV